MNDDAHLFFSLVAQVLDGSADYRLVTSSTPRDIRYHVEIVARKFHDNNLCSSEELLKRTFDRIDSIRDMIYAQMSDATKRQEYAEREMLRWAKIFETELKK